MTALYSTVYAAVYSRFGNREKGATAVEYGLLVALIAAAIITAVAGFGTELKSLFTSVAENVQKRGA